MTSAIIILESKYEETKKEYNNTCLANCKFHDPSSWYIASVSFSSDEDVVLDDILKGLKNLRGEVRRSPVHHVCAC